MIRKMYSVCKYFVQLVHTKLDPIGYAKKIGVKMGTNVNFYGMKVHMFSTEPWLITLGNNVYITADCQFITHDGGTLILRDKIPDLELTAPIHVGNNVYIGIRTIIMPGVTIGDNVIIGAGSIVSKSIPSNTVAAGVPARVIKSLDAYIQKAEINSLHLGHLKGSEKAKELKKLFNVH